MRQKSKSEKQKKRMKWIREDHFLNILLSTCSFGHLSEKNYFYTKVCDLLIHFNFYLSERQCKVQWKGAYLNQPDYVLLIYENVVELDVCNTLKKVLGQRPMFTNVLHHLSFKLHFLICHCLSPVWHELGLRDLMYGFLLA